MARKNKLTFDEMIEVTKQRQRLLNRLVQGELSSLPERIAFILNRYPETRDSNITLSIRYYEVFHPDRVRDGWIRLDDFYDLPKMYDMQRHRAKIQNEYGLFLANEEVRRRRLQLAKDARREFGTKDDALPSVTIYCDESGKDRDYTVVGSIWFYNLNRVFEVEGKLSEWKQGKGYSREFKFSDLTYRTLPLAMEFFSLAVSQTDSISLKAVALETHSAQLHHDQLVYRLHYETMLKGVEFDLAHGRMRLPRVVFLAKDEDKVPDALWGAELGRKLRYDCQQFFSGEIRVEEVFAVDSQDHTLLQVADLFTGSISRVLNRGTDVNGNEKDEFAAFVCDALSLDPRDVRTESGVDWVMTHIFRA